MASLSENNRRACWADLMRRMGPTGALTKAQLRAAVDAVDDWAEANAVEFNQAIPQPARGVLTAKQKAIMLAIVILKREEVT